MMLDWTAISGSASVISAFAAAVAAALSFKAVRAARIVTGEQRANDYFKRYLELAIEYPELSTDDDAGEDKRDQQRYEWFVSFMLMTAREVLLAHGHDENWRTMISEQIKYNEVELNIWRKKYPLVLRSFGADVERLVNDALADIRPTRRTSGGVRR